MHWMMTDVREFTGNGRRRDSFRFIGVGERIGRSLTVVTVNVVVARITGQCDE
jgi:hypothetical protein